MKKLILILAIALSFGACTENARTRSFGGTETIDLPQGQRLVTATWKESDLWYLTEPMSEDYVPKTLIFQEKSSFGAWEGSVVFKESR